MGYINAETIDTQLEPEVQYILKVLADHRVIPIEIRLLYREKVQVPLPRCAVRLDDSLPGWPTKYGLPVIRRQFAICALAIPKYISIALRGSWRGFEGLLEPLVLVRGVVWHDIDDEFHPQGMGLIDQPLGLIQGSIVRFDIHVIRNVIPVIHLRRWVPRGDPDSVNT